MKTNQTQTSSKPISLANNCRDVAWLPARKVARFSVAVAMVAAFALPSQATAAGCCSAWKRCVGGPSDLHTLVPDGATGG